MLLKIRPSGGGATSTGPTPLPLNDTSPTNNRIDPPEIQDVRVAWAVEIGQPGAWNAPLNPGDEGAVGRALCFDLAGNLRVEMHYSDGYYRIDANTGQQFGPPVKTTGHRPYGCVVDMNGRP